jgi:hypothetical protein
LPEQERRTSLTASQESLVRGVASSLGSG